MDQRRRNMSYASKPSRAARNAHRMGEKQFRTYDTSYIQPKKSKAPIVVAVLLLLAILGGVGFFLVNAFSGTEVAQGEEITVVIPEGATTKQIGQTLQDQKVISNAGNFVSKVNARNAANSLKPGTYVFVGGAELDSIIDQLIAGPTTVSIVVPEGKTMAGIAEIVETSTNGKIKGADFLALAKDASKYESDYSFVKGAYDNSLEGFLFPKTYAVTSDDTADSLIRMMLDQYATELATLDYTKAKKAGLSEYQVLVLASIIEREATDGNRNTVSSVFYNRLATDMPLQSDATVAYLIGDDPTPDDLKIESPYNTYLNKGLTPGPICNPGLASLEAACNPEDTDYLYFYFATDDSGVMKYYFSKTYEEHQKAIEEG